MSKELISQIRSLILSNLESQKYENLSDFLFNFTSFNLELNNELKRIKIELEEKVIQSYANSEYPIIKTLTDKNNIKVSIKLINNLVDDPKFVHQFLNLPENNIAFYFSYSVLLSNVEYILKMFSVVNSSDSRKLVKILLKSDYFFEILISGKNSYLNFKNKNFLNVLRLRDALEENKDLYFGKSAALFRFSKVFNYIQIFNGKVRKNEVKYRNFLITNHRNSLSSN
jgi:hypothetical protein